MPIFHEVEQGTVAWLNARLGIATASNFHRIVTPTGKISKQARDYACLLVAERMLGRPLVDIDYLDAIARGKTLEPEAVRLYEFDRDLDVQTVGLVTTNDGRVGASPDRLVGEPGILEVKSPLAPHHMSYLLFGFGNDYRPQRQGQLLVTERDWVDIMSYHPELPPRIERHHRDDAYIGLLSESLDQFNDMLDEMLARARASGIAPYTDPELPKPEQPASPSLAETIRLNEAAIRLYAP